MKNKKIYIIIGFILLVIYFVISIISNQSKVVDKEKIKLQLSTDYNDYVTVNTLVNDYLLYLSLNNQESVKGITGSEVKEINSNENIDIIFVAIPKRDYYKLKEGIKKIDKEAFFVVSSSYEVGGGK